MKKLNIFMFSFFFFLFPVTFMNCTGCVSYPERYLNEKGDSLEPDSCFDYRVCMYYVVKGNLQSNCNQEFIKCCKARTYAKCGNDSYRWKDQKAEHCWDKLE